MDFTADRETRIAALTIGYADACPGRWAPVWAGYSLAAGAFPIVGRICMDQTLVDVTAIPEVRAGDPVTLLGESGGAAISACDMAEQAGTIANEILSRLGSRLERWPVGQTEPAWSLRWPWPGRRLEPGRHRAETKKLLLNKFRRRYFQENQASLLSFRVMQLFSGQRCSCEEFPSSRPGQRS